MPIDPHIKEQIRAALAAKYGRRMPRRLPRPALIPHPDRVVRAYRRELRAWVDALQRLALNTILPAYPRIAEERAAVDPSPLAAEAAGEQTGQDSWGDTLNGIMLAFAGSARELTPAQGWANVARHFGRMTADVNKAGWHRSIMRTLGVNILAAEPWLEGEIDAFAGQNADLITTLGQQAINRVQQVTVDGLRTGRRVESIRRDLIEQFGITRRHADLIARDQTAKLNGQITQARQSALGIEEYEWATVGDDRVRKSHAEKNGQRFRWDSPPADTGHPGEDINCRCTALPVLDGLLDFGDEN